MCELSEQQLSGWRRRLEADWTQIRQQLIAELEAARLDDIGVSPAQCEVESLVAMARTVLGPGVEAPIARLLHLDAALCQMELGLYGLCSDCEEPLDPIALDNDPAMQRCPRCEARYRKGDHTREL